MKKLYTILIVILVVAVGTVSCSKDSLETSPTTAVSGDGLFTNATAALVPLHLYFTASCIHLIGLQPVIHTNALESLPTTLWQMSRVKTT